MKNWIILFCLIVAVFAAATLIYVLVSALRELFRRREERAEHIYVDQFTDISSTASQTAVHKEDKADAVAVVATADSEATPEQASAPAKPGAYNKRNPVDRLKLLLIAGAVYTVTGALVWRAASFQQDED